MIIKVFILFLLLSTLTFNGFVVVKSETNELGFIIKMSVTYHNNGTENWAFTNEDRAIGLFMNNTWQTVQLINYSYSIENVTFDEDGCCFHVARIDLFRVGTKCRNRFHPRQGHLPSLATWSP